MVTCFEKIYMVKFQPNIYVPVLFQYFTKLTNVVLLKHMDIMCMKAYLHLILTYFFVFVSYKKELGCWSKFLVRNISRTLLAETDTVAHARILINGQTKGKQHYFMFCE
jgi:hypothetical protein